MPTPYALLTDIAACLCAELGDGLCFCGVVPGREFAHDYIWTCDTDGPCGAAWVRLVTAYPADGVGVRQQNPTGCGTSLGLDVEVGVLRCVEQPSNGKAPTEEMLAVAAEEQLGDLVAIRRMLSCCSSLTDLDYTLGTYTPIGPRGAVAGGTWSLSVLL